MDQHHDPTSEEFWGEENMRSHPELVRLYMVIFEITMLSNKFRENAYSAWAPEAHSLMLKLQNSQFSQGGWHPEGVMPLLCRRFKDINQAALVALRYPKGYKKERGRRAASTYVHWELIAPKCKYVELPSE